MIPLHGSRPCERDLQLERGDDVFEVAGRVEHGVDRACHELQSEYRSAQMVGDYKNHSNQGRTTKMSISEKLESLGSLSLPTSTMYHFFPAAEISRFICEITSK